MNSLGSVLPIPWRRWPIFIHLLAMLLADTTRAATQLQQQQLTNDPTAYFGDNDNDVYLDWLSNRSSIAGLNYTSSTFLSSATDATNGAAIHWRLDSDYIHLAIVAKAQGWVGFGLSQAGGMLGSDMALFVVNEPSSIQDAHVIENRVPQLDCHQDWEFVSSELREDFLMVEARRRLDTEDPQDRPILDDSETLVPPHRLIAAWGDDPDRIGYHGPNNVARGAVRFYSETNDDDLVFRDKMQAKAEGSFVVLAPNYTIPAKETTYAYFCFTRSDLIAQGVPTASNDDSLNIIGFNAIVSPDSAQYVHHFVVSATSDAGGSCSTDTVDRSIDNGIFSESRHEVVKLYE